MGVRAFNATDMLPPNPTVTGNTISDRAPVKSSLFQLYPWNQRKVQADIVAMGVTSHQETHRVRRVSAPHTGASNAPIPSSTHALSQRRIGRRKSALQPPQTRWLPQRIGVHIHEPIPDGVQEISPGDACAIITKVHRYKDSSRPR